MDILYELEQNKKDNYIKTFGVVTMNDKKFVIKLVSDKTETFLEEEGYWSGKTYELAGSMFPVLDNEITDRTRRYLDVKRATKMANKLLSRCDYVHSYVIVPIETYE